MPPAIKVENLSKIYQIGEIGTGTLSRDLERWWVTRILGKEDPFLKIGQTNDRAKKGESNVVYSLKDINFEIEQGDAVGIIGKNGAGKSTLLKILSRVTSPTTGKIQVRGRVASLLEVGTGFHPELTGRENIYLNGAILGMRKKEITRKLDEIIDFSGVERYIDTPVKRYSSGMYVRLAFAVAAHLESEILIVDEVLAVGDAEFQKKCLGKMGEVSKGEGRTVLFVSHNISSVRQLCSQGIVMANGNLIYYGSSNEAINYYLSQQKTSNLSTVYKKRNLENKDVELVQAEVLNYNLQPATQFDIVQPIFVRVLLRCIQPIPNLYAYVAIKNAQEELIIESDSFDLLPNVLEQMKPGQNIFYLKINQNVLAIGDYTMYMSFASTHSNSFLVDVPMDILNFTVVDHSTQRGAQRRAKTSHLIQWQPEHAL
jgi:lipopolysaccharide transport system ATP-binding protein